MKCPQLKSKKRKKLGFPTAAMTGEKVRIGKALLDGVTLADFPGPRNMTAGNSEQIRL